MLVPEPAETCRGNMTPQVLMAVSLSVCVCVFFFFFYIATALIALNSVNASWQRKREPFIFQCRLFVNKCALLKPRICDTTVNVTPQQLASLLKLVWWQFNPHLNHWFCLFARQNWKMHLSKTDFWISDVEDSSIKSESSFTVSLD